MQDSYSKLVNVMELTGPARLFAQVRLSVVLVLCGIHHFSALRSYDPNGPQVKFVCLIIRSIAPFFYPSMLILHSCDSLLPNELKHWDLRLLNRLK